MTVSEESALKARVTELEAAIVNVTTILNNQFMSVHNLIECQQKMEAWAKDVTVAINNLNNGNMYLPAHGLN